MELRVGRHRPRCARCNSDKPVTIVSGVRVYCCSNCLAHDEATALFRFLGDEIKFGSGGSPATLEKVRELVTLLENLTPIHPDTENFKSCPKCWGDTMQNYVDDGASDSMATKLVYICSRCGRLDELEES